MSTRLRSVPLRRWPLLLLAAAAGACTPPPPQDAGADLSAVLAAPEDAGFAAVERPAMLQFPRDHGPHPRHRIEWWYLTANLQDETGRHYGLQFALFRLALRPPGTQDPAGATHAVMAAADPSDAAADAAESGEGWNSPQLYMLHTALTDTEAGRFRFEERLARPAAGLAGAQSEPFAAWLEDCALREEGDALGLQCRGDGYAVRLSLKPDKPLVRHGEDGWSAKLPDGSLASYYVSWTRLAAEGVLTLQGHERPVRGGAWFDHEWSSALLRSVHAGWDWFSLQLDDGSELMLFRIRDRDGRVLATRGTLVAPDGSTHAFAEGTISVTPTRHWTSPHSGARYPLGWRLRSSALELELVVEPRLDDQELRTSVRYWEGAVSARGRRAGSEVTAAGYLELTGYGPGR